jgi:hypothetical protein
MFRIVIIAHVGLLIISGVLSFPQERSSCVENSDCKLGSKCVSGQCYSLQENIKDEPNTPNVEDKSPERETIPKVEEDPKISSSEENLQVICTSTFDCNSTSTCVSGFCLSDESHFGTDIPVNPTSGMTNSTEEKVEKSNMMLWVFVGAGVGSSVLFIAFAVVLIKRCNDKKKIQQLKRQQMQSVHYNHQQPEVNINPGWMPPIPKITGCLYFQ